MSPCSFERSLDRAIDWFLARQPHDPHGGVGRRRRVVALRRVGDAVFKQPVKIGDTLQVEGEILRTQELDPEHGLVEARIRIVNQHGRLAVRASVELVWRA